LLEVHPIFLFLTREYHYLFSKSKFIFLSSQTKYCKEPTISPEQGLHIPYISALLSVLALALWLTGFMWKLQDSPFFLALIPPPKKKKKERKKERKYNGKRPKEMI
jgi:hypothetical protein